MTKEVEELNIKELEIIIEGRGNGVKNEMNKLYFINKVVLGRSFLTIGTCCNDTDNKRKYIITLEGECIIPQDYELELISYLNKNSSKKLNLKVLF